MPKPSTFGVGSLGGGLFCDGISFYEADIQAEVDGRGGFFLVQKGLAISGTTRPMICLSGILSPFLNTVKAYGQSQDDSLNDHLGVGADIHHDHSCVQDSDDQDTGQHVAELAVSAIYGYTTQNSSPIDFLNRYRLEISYNLLEDKKWSITDVAIYCGFATCSYFTSQFRKTYGYTPSEYRNLMIR